MRGKLLFLGGLAVGFVVGTRAGREKYDELVQTARKVKESPTVQEAAGVVQAQATRLYTEGKGVVTDKLATSRFADTTVGQRLLSAADADAGAKAINHKKNHPDDLSTTGSISSQTASSAGL
jgi:hypothetical protein